MQDKYCYICYIYSTHMHHTRYRVYSADVLYVRMTSNLSELGKRGIKKSSVLLKILCNQMTFDTELLPAVGELKRPSLYEPN